MDEKNFKLTRISKITSEEDEMLIVYATYDVGILGLSSRLVIEYTPGNNIKLKTCDLDMALGGIGEKIKTQFVDNELVSIEKNILLNKRQLLSVSEDYFRTDPRYRAMIGLIPDNEPIKPVLEKLVR